MKQLSVDDGQEIYELLQDLPDEENGFRNPVYGKDWDVFKRWLAKCDADSKKLELDDTDEDAEFDDGWGVPKTIFWLYYNDRPVGMAKLRHYLTESLLDDGGHVGYSVRQGERGRGHGKIMLRELIKEAKKMQIDELLLTIKPDNISSIKVALANGGVIEKEENGWQYIWIDCVI